MGYAGQCAAQEEAARKCTEYDAMETKLEIAIKALECIQDDSDSDLASRWAGRALKEIRGE